jgi:hypothetical protein
VISVHGRFFRRPDITVVMAPLLGTAVAVAAVITARLDLRHSLVVFAASVLPCIFLAARDKAWMLTSVFVLSVGTTNLALQLLDNGSTAPGLEIHLALFLGLVAVAGTFVLGTPDQLRRPFRWLGQPRLPIVAVLLTSAVSLLGTSELRAGLAQLFADIQAYAIYVIALNLATSTLRFRRAITLLLVSLTVQSVVSIVDVGSQWAEGRDSLSAQPQITETGWSREREAATAASLGGPPQATGVLGGNPAHLVAFSLPILMIALGRLVTARRRAETFAFAAVTALGSLALALTFKRAAWVAFAFGLAWIMAATSRVRLSARRRRRLLWIAAGALVAGLLLWPLMALRLNTSPVTEAYDERSLMMRIAVRVIAANPLVGVGDGVYRLAYKSFARAERGKHWITFVHNQYLMRAAETGVPGLVAFVSLIICALRQAWRLTRSDEQVVAATALGWSAAIVALCWHMTWEPWRDFPDVAVFWFVLGLMQGMEINQGRARPLVSAMSGQVSSSPHETDSAEV